MGSAVSRPAHSARGLGQGSAWALAAIGATALGGFAFWALAATTSTADGAVGRAAAWYTVTQLIVAVTGLGAPILVNRTGGTSRAPLVAGAAAAAVAFSATVLGLAAPLIASPGWATLGSLNGVSRSLLIAFLAAGSALTLGVDARLVSIRRWQLLFVRAAIPAMARLPLLLVDPLDDRALWLLLAAAAPTALSGFVAAALLANHRLIAFANPASLGREDRSFFVSQHLGALAVHLPYHAVPLIVARSVDTTLNAAFYFVWGIGVMATLVPNTLGQVLLSETSLDAANRVLRIRLTLAANVGIGVAGWLASVLFGRRFLLLIGPLYGQLAPLLPWLFGAALCWGITSVALTETRIARDNATTMAITWSIATLAIGLAAILVARNPIWGATWAWVVAQTAGMFLAVVTVDRLRHTRPEGYLHG